MRQENPFDFPRLRPRLKARYFAVVATYQVQVTREAAEKVLQLLWLSEEGSRADALIRSFATQLVRLTFQHLERIDVLIRHYAPQRELHRIAEVDLALLRVGAAELLFFSDVPPSVTINEMVELAKLLSAEESPPFINAVLDRLKEHRNEIAASEKVSSQWSTWASA